MSAYRPLVMHEMLHGAGFANTMFNYARDGEGRRKGLIELREVRMYECMLHYLIAC